MELLGFIRMGRLWNDEDVEKLTMFMTGYRESSIVFNVSRESIKQLKVFGRWWTASFWYYIKLCKEIIWKCLDPQTVLAVLSIDEKLEDMSRQRRFGVKKHLKMLVNGTNVSAGTKLLASLEGNARLFLNNDRFIKTWNIYAFDNQMLVVIQSILNSY